MYFFACFPYFLRVLVCMRTSFASCTLSALSASAVQKTHGYFRHAPVLAGAYAEFGRGGPGVSPGGGQGGQRPLLGCGGGAPACGRFFRIEGVKNTLLCISNNCWLTTITAILVGRLGKRGAGNN